MAWASRKEGDRIGVGPDPKVWNQEYICILLDVFWLS